MPSTRTTATRLRSVMVRLPNSSGGASALTSTHFDRRGIDATVIPVTAMTLHRVAFLAAKRPRPDHPAIKARPIRMATARNDEAQLSCGQFWHASGEAHRPSPVVPMAGDRRVGLDRPLRCERDGDAVGQPCNERRLSGALPRVHFLNPRAPAWAGLRPAPTIPSPQYGCQRLWSQGVGPGYRAVPGPALSCDQPLPPASLPFGQRFAS